MKVEINYEVPERCVDCRFIITKSRDFGRTNAFICILTVLGDSHSESGADRNRAEKRIREECPFLKKRKYNEMV